MAGELAQLSGLNCVYFALLGVGVMYAMVILVAGELHGFGVHADMPVHLDIGAPDVLHGEVDVMSLSPITLAGFVTAFGAFGLISSGLFDATAAGSLVWAAVGGIVVGVASHVAFITFFIKPQGSSEVTRADIVGAVAEVITPVPKGKVGEIALVAQGARITMTARGRGDQAVKRGTMVRIHDVVGSVALVGPVSEDVK